MELPHHGQSQVALPIKNLVDTITSADNKPVVVAFNAKYDAFVAQDAGSWVSRLDVMSTLPLGMLYFIDPGFQRTFSARVLFPSRLDC